LGAFDYRPYLDAMHAATSPDLVDHTPPGLVVQAPTSGSTYDATGRSTMALQGDATDQLAIRDVYCEVDGGAATAAKMVWQRTSGDDKSGWTWRMSWSIDAVHLHPGVNHLRIVAEDIKGLTAS